VGFDGDGEFGCRHAVLLSLCFFIFYFFSFLLFLTDLCFDILRHMCKQVCSFLLFLIFISLSMQLYFLFPFMKLF
jgi:hypothetical protein